MTVETKQLFSFSQRFDDEGQTGFHVQITGTPNPEMRRKILLAAMKAIQGELLPLDCPRAGRLHGPLRYCPDCPGGDACELSRRALGGSND